jgi:hypothetical protein
LLLHTLADGRGKVIRQVSSVAAGTLNLAGDVTGLAFDLGSRIARQAAYVVLNLPSDTLECAFDTTVIHFAFPFHCLEHNGPDCQAAAPAQQSVDRSLTERLPTPPQLPQKHGLGRLQFDSRCFTQFP